MSRSYRKTPVAAFTTAGSEKYDKQKANRRFRRINKRILENQDENPLFKTKNEVSDIYDWAKDGKMYWPEWMVDKNDPDEVLYHAKWMRK